jgi:hypothetical protein
MTDTTEQRQDLSEEPVDQEVDQEQEEDQGQAPPDQHVDTRGMAFHDLRVLYVPVPKAGCTAILWTLAEMSGLQANRFHTSFGREVSRSLTIHDLKAWPPEFRFGNLPQEKKDEILAADDWLRFTVVRHPFRRLWSAWQSKILLNEPQFTEKFAAEPWFPPSVDSADDVLKMFRQFLGALEENRDLVNADVHWAPQVPLTAYGDLPYTYVGRVEKMGETVARMREHLESVTRAQLPDLPRANVAPLPYVDELFDEADVKILGELFADDLREFEYDPPPSDLLNAPCPQSWIDEVDAAAPALEELRGRNERVADLQILFKDKRDELNARIRKRNSRIEEIQGRNEELRKRNKREASLRSEEQRRNERLQKRLQQTTGDITRLKNSASWRYTAPLRRLSRLGRKALRRQGRG